MCSSDLPEDGELRSARPRARTRAQPQKTTNSASTDPGLGLRPGLSRRPPPRPTQGLGLGLDLGRQTRPRPRRSLRLALPRARTDHATGGAIITLPLASSGYGGQDRRPIWLAPVKQVMMAPRVLHDDGGSQPPYGSKDSTAPTAVLPPGSSAPPTATTSHEQGAKTSPAAMTACT